MQFNIVKIVTNVLLITVLSIISILINSCSNGTANTVTTDHSQFLYGLNYIDSPSSQTIYTYTINPSNGRLIPTTESLSISPNYAGNVAKLKSSYNGYYAYALNEGTDGSVLMYAINQNNGALSPLSESSVAAGFKPFSMTFNQAGTFAYVVTEYRESAIQVISMYGITDGILSPLAVPMLTTQSAPTYVAVTPNSKFAYVSNYSDNTLYSYTISESGILQPLANESVIATGNVPFLVVTNPTGTNVYVINYSDNTISMYSINQITGELTPLRPESTVITGQQDLGFQSFVIVPSGNYAYVNNAVDNTISMYSINESGRLTPLAESIINTPTYISELAIDASGNYLYAGGANSLIYMYSISESGLLIPLSQESAVAIAGIPLSIVTN